MNKGRSDQAREHDQAQARQFASPGQGTVERSPEPPRANQWTDQEREEVRTLVARSTIPVQPAPAVSLPMPILPGDDKAVRKAKQTFNAFEAEVSQLQAELAELTQQVERGWGKSLGKLKERIAHIEGQLEAAPAERARLDQKVRSAQQRQFTNGPLAEAKRRAQQTAEAYTAAEARYNAAKAEFEAATKELEQAKRNKQDALYSANHLEQFGY